MNQIDEKSRFEIIALRCMGHSIREIVERTGHAKMTVCRYIEEVRDKIDGRPPIPERKPAKALLCDQCRLRPIGLQADFHRKTRRFRHKFCSAACYGEFMRVRRAKDLCLRCGVKRSDLSTPCFTKGYCGRCYQILKAFNFDEALADAHDDIQDLKEVIKGGDRKHCRPA